MAISDCNCNRFREVRRSQFRQLTDVDAEEDVSLTLGGLEVVDLVVDLEPPDAAHEAGGCVQEVTFLRRFKLVLLRTVSIEKLKTINKNTFFAGKYQRTWAMAL